MRIFKKLLKALLIVLGVVVLLAGGLLGWLSATEYNPESVEELSVSGSGSGSVKAESTLRVLSWNTGYCGLGKYEDFFMDGGSGVLPSSREAYDGYQAGVAQTLADTSADVYMLQEVDTDSKHGYHVNQAELFARGSSVYAYNYRCAFVPYPVPPIGEVNCGLLTYSDRDIASAQRISLPCPFSWPLRIANLKRCMMPAYLPIEGSDKMLVTVNVHLEAYDDGEGKAAQTRELLSFIQSEYDKGNYVIVGGDFNQSFPGSLDVYPNTHPQLWSPGLLSEDMLPQGWSFAYDLSAPSCRLNNQPYDAADTVNTQHYVIDGFILSPNVTLESVETQNNGFEFSDHNPVLLSVKLS